MKKTLQRQPFICLQIKLQRKLIKAFIFNLGSILKCSITESPKGCASSVLRTRAANPGESGAENLRSHRHPPGTGGKVLSGEHELPACCSLALLVTEALARCTTIMPTHCSVQMQLPVMPLIRCLSWTRGLALLSLRFFIYQWG